MVDDTYYITPHEAALAVVATAMKKSRLPFHILFINSIIGGFLFSAGGMLYVMCEAGSQGLLPGYEMFLWIAQGAMYAIGLFYVIVCGMELFNSNILFFATGVMRGAVTLMDLIISWFVSFWVNLASTLFVVYVICYESGVMKQDLFITASVSIARSKDSYSFAEIMLKGIAGNFFVCLAVYLQIMVKPLHVKFVVLFLPVYTFVAMGFTHCVADMFLIPAGIFNDCGYGFGHYFWKIMLPGTIGNIIGGSFFGIVIPWYLHLYVIESDMKKLNLPAYEERDEQPMLNMDSRVVRVPTHISQVSSTEPTIREFKPNTEMDMSRSTSSNLSSALASTLSRRTTSASMRNRRPIRSPKGVFPVVDMGEPLQHEKTIASAYTPAAANIDDALDDNIDHQSYDSEAVSSITDPDNEISIYSGPEPNDAEFAPNMYDPEAEKVSAKLMRAITRTVTRGSSNDLEKGNAGDTNNDRDDESEANIFKAITRTATRVEQNLEAGIADKLNIPTKTKSRTKTKTKTSRKNSTSSLPDRLLVPPPAAVIAPSSSKTQSSRKSVSSQTPKISDRLFRQFTFGGGGDNAGEIHRRLADAKITKRAAGMSNDIAGIHVDTVDKSAVDKNSISNSRRNSTATRKQGDSLSSRINDPKLGGPYASDTWKHFTYDYDLNSELPVSFISEQSQEDDTVDDKDK